MAAAAEAFPKWANTPAKERARLMRRLGELIDQNVPMLAELETRDTGLPISQTRKQLIPRASENFNFFAEVCTRMNGHTYPVDDQMLNYAVPAGGRVRVGLAVGVPFATATWKTAPCLALGNTAVLKMSELSPLTADQLGMLALEAGIPPGVLNVVQGYGADAGDALVRHPGVRAISFTGGTVTGKKILASAGGIKILDGAGRQVAGAGVRRRRRRARAGRGAVHHLLAQRRALHRGLAHLRAGNHLRRFRAPLRRAREPAGGGRPDRRAYPCRFDDHAPALGKGHWLHPSGRGRGRPRAGGRSELPAGLPARLAGGNFVRPTVLADVDNRMRCAQEEIFGPVACLLPFRTRSTA